MSTYHHRINRDDQGYSKEEKNTRKRKWKRKD